MKLEPNICLVCWAMQNPTDGTCLVCGEKYNILDVPVSLNPNQKPYFGKFLVPFANGFITFYADARMEFICPPPLEITADVKAFPINDESQIRLTFDFIPDDETQTLLQVYTNAAL